MMIPRQCYELCISPAREILSGTSRGSLIKVIVAAVSAVLFPVSMLCREVRSRKMEKAYVLRRTLETQRTLMPNVGSIPKHEHGV